MPRPPCRRWPGCRGSARPYRRYRQARPAPPRTAHLPCRPRPHLRTAQAAAAPRRDRWDPGGSRSS
ncbi:hypothetical protein D9R08_09235 [Rhodophyticola porphyridii]|uniref:Uncharacterized protein n=1 Tax=Rhodophyticola porphyridii TaxID=1852017 RepID=A0A3L9Y5F9_9RHOB|nr:hypothetical protein D9R08_09235 [Rhodophyticola porphyridii]